VFVLQSNLIAQEAKFQQSSGDDGLVCMEAEHNTGMRESAVNSYWELTEDPAETLAGTQVESAAGSAFSEFSLAQNYPNPFNPSTTIQYSLPTAEFVTLQIFNLAGKQVASHANGFQTVGDYQATWTSEGLPSGLYFYRLQAGEFSQTKKLTLQK
jgi:hypothetical protein